MTDEFILRVCLKERVPETGWYHAFGAGAGRSSDQRAHGDGPASAAATTSLHVCTGSPRRPIPRPPSSHPRSLAAGRSGSIRVGMPFASDAARPALGLNDFKRTSMMRLFARRQDSRPSSEPRTGSAPPRAADRPGRRERRRARPEAEVLDSRLLMASGNPATADATASSDLSDRVAQALKPYFAQDDFPGISVAIVKRRASRPGARIRGQRRGDRLARPGRHPVRHRFGDEDVHRPRRPAPLPGEPGHVPPARPQRPYQ